MRIRCFVMKLRSPYFCVTRELTKCIYIFAKTLFFIYHSDFDRGHNRRKISKDRGVIFHEAARSPSSRFSEALGWHSLFQHGNTELQPLNNEQCDISGSRLGLLVIIHDIWQIEEDHLESRWDLEILSARSQAK